MKFEEDILQAKFKINSCENNKITINNENYSKSLIITKDDLSSDWEINDINKITQKDIELLSKSSPELFIIGTGDISIYPNKEVLSLLYNSKTPFEIMSSPSACRTYNLLISDNRHIAVGLILN
tara:strand:- start:194 stop:565 length:372 start_codon:yes stop_codon:yes gene_type:complete